MTMAFLLTNDDGISAPGLWAAARALAPLGRVAVIAPLTNQSGMGAALPAVSELRAIPYEHVPADLDLLSAFALPATPATCVQVGLSGALVKQPITLVVSGINDSYNLGRDVIYSGTVGAAITAHLLGVPAVAASFDAGRSGTHHWETAEWALREIVRGLLAGTTVHPPLLNLNIPNCPVIHVAGVEMTSLSEHSLLKRYQITAQEGALLKFESRPDPEHGADGSGTDRWAVQRGALSVSPLRLFGDVLTAYPWTGSTLGQTRRQAVRPAWLAAAG